MLGGNPQHDRLGFRYWKDVRVSDSLDLSMAMVLTDNVAVLPSVRFDVDTNSLVPWQNSTFYPSASPSRHSYHAIKSGN